MFTPVSQKMNSEAKSTYKTLDKESIPGYLSSLPSVVSLLGDCTNIDISEIGDGNLNFVYRVSSSADPSKSVILKQAVPYLRMVGEEWPLSRDRMTFEIRALKQYNNLTPDLVPEIYHADEEMSVLVMQCLDDHIILRQGMIDGIVYPHLAEHVGRFLAETLFHTSIFGMNSIDRRELMDNFLLNTELCKLTEDFIFTFPYMEHESNYSNPTTDSWSRENLHTNTAYKLAVLQLKEKFMTKSDALLHADLHTGSIMVNTKESYVIDMEFAYFGPFGFDLGKIFANFLLCHTAHYAIGDDTSYQAWLLDESFRIWEVFVSRFIELWKDHGESAILTDGMLNEAELEAYQSAFMQEMMRDAVGFAACSLARRSVGIAGVADIRDIDDAEVRAELEITNLKLSIALMSAHDSINSIDDVSSLVRSFYSKCSFNFQG